MTLEEAVAEVEQATESLNGPDPSQASLRMIAKVARAFLKMLEALKRAEWSGIQHHSDASCCPFCGATMGSGVHGAHCAMDDALRAAREAVKP